MAKINKDGICMCRCHQVGVNLLHIMACCRYCGKKYIAENGKFDQEAYDNIVAYESSPEHQAEIEAAREKAIQEALKRN